MFILSSPSGAGKTTLAQMLLKVDKHLRVSVSCTTRQPRPGEVDGVHYHFVTAVQFQEMVKNEEFLEYAEVFGNFYGTPRRFVEEQLRRGEDVLFDIEWQGNRALTKTAREDVVSVFIFPPSKQELFDRLSARKQDSAEVVKYRMQKANEELSHWEEYDYSIINKELNKTLKKLLSILRAERLKKARRLGITDFVEKLQNEEVRYNQ